MKFKYLIIAAGIIGATGVAKAQQWSVTTGQLYSQSTFNPTDILKMSQLNNGFGTARSTAMGGAFTSLGADLSSMNINPAGLGMYRSSEIGITPSVTIGKIDHSSPDLYSQWGNSKTRFAFNNAGIALNLYQGSGTLTSFTFGFGYNKLADFNYQSTTSLYADNGTIGDIFLRQLNGYNSNILQDSPDGRYTPWVNSNIPVFDWGAVLGYKTYFVDENGNNNYILNTVSQDAEVSHYLRTKSKGSIGEYNISGGFNLQNKLYLGLSIGIQDIYLKQRLNYVETFANNEGAADKDDYARTLYFDQYKKLSGTGVNFKFGAIYRPIDGLRIGLALHTPTISSVRMEYGAGMQGVYANSTSNYVETLPNVYDYDFLTPTRLLTGISYSFADIGVISADYERTWYNGMRYKNDDGNEDWFKDEIKYYFKGGNTFRVGAEVKPHPLVAVRGGFMWSGSFINDNHFDVDQDRFDSPVAYQSYNISGGLGFKLGARVMLDLTYVYMNTKYTDYDMYFYRAEYANGGYDQAIAGNLTQKLNRHNIVMTLACRF